LIGIEWIPLIVATVSIVGAAITYAYQKRVDRKSALVELRRSAYREYIKSFMAMTNNTNGDKAISNQFNLVELHMLVVGSDEVIRRGARFLPSMVPQTTTALTGTY
jgi:hypothetical protein